MSKKKSVNVFLVLDETGSMQSCKSQTISGYNEYVGSLKREKKVTYKFSLLKFNSMGKTLVHDAVSLKEVFELNEDTYHPDHTTPLYDAVAKGINSLEKKKNVLFIIQTDGEENASQEFSRKQVFDLIQEKTTKGWQFVFLGANQDAWNAGAQMGISRGQTISYDNAQTSEAFDVLSRSTVAYASTNATPTADFFEKTDIRKEKQNETN